MAQIPQSLFGKLAVLSEEAKKAITKGVEEKHSIALLENLGVNQRLLNILELQGISTLGDLMWKKREELMEYPNFGEKQLILLFDSLSKYHTLK